MKKYRGEGMPWADFLHHRRRVIDEFLQEGKSCKTIAIALSMDAEQVKLISESDPTASEAIFDRVALMKAALRN